MSRQRDDALLTTLAVVGSFAVVGFTVVAMNLGPAFAIPVGIIASAAAAIVLRGPLGQALARRLEGRTDASTDSEAVLRALDEVRGEMAELAERVDFTERVLTQQQREPDRLQG